MTTTHTKPRFVPSVGKWLVLRETWADGHRIATEQVWEPETEPDNNPVVAIVLNPTNQPPTTTKDKTYGR